MTNKTIANNTNDTNTNDTTTNETNDSGARWKRTPSDVIDSTTV